MSREITVVLSKKKKKKDSDKKETHPRGVVSSRRRADDGRRRINPSSGIRFFDLGWRVSGGTVPEHYAVENLMVDHYSGITYDDSDATLLPAVDAVWTGIQNRALTTSTSQLSSTFKQITRASLFDKYLGVVYEGQLNRLSDLSVWDGNVLKPDASQVDNLAFTGVLPSSTRPLSNGYVFPPVWLYPARLHDGTAFGFFVTALPSNAAPHVLPPLSTKMDVYLMPSIAMVDASVGGTDGTTTVTIPSHPPFTGPNFWAQTIGWVFGVLPREQAGEFNQILLESDADAFAMARHVWNIIRAQPDYQIIGETSVLDIEPLIDGIPYPWVHYGHTALVDSFPRPSWFTPGPVYTDAQHFASVGDTTSFGIDITDYGKLFAILVIGGTPYYVWANLD